MDERTLVDQLRGIVSGVAGDARMPADFDDNTPLAEGGLWLDSVESCSSDPRLRGHVRITFEPGEG